MTKTLTQRGLHIRSDFVCVKSGSKYMSPSKSRFILRTLQTLLMCMALQFPLIGYCDTGGWLESLFESKGKPMQDVATQVAELPEDHEIWGLDFSPDGKHLAATSPNSLTIHIWDWRAGKIIHSVYKANGGNDGLSTEPIRYSPDGRLLVTCHDRAVNNIVVRIWNTDTWEIVHDIEAPNKGTGCNAVGFSPDGKSLYRVLDRLYFPGDNLIVYDTSTWQAVWGLRTVPFQPNSLATSPDGKFVALGGMLLNPITWPFNTPIPTFGNPPLSDMPLINIVDLAQHKIVRTMKNKGGRIAWSPDGDQLASDWGGGVEIFDAHTGMKLAEEKTDGGHAFVRYTPDGKYLISGTEGINATIQIWDARNRTPLQVIPGEARGLAVSADGHYLAIGRFRDIQVWALK